MIIDEVIDQVITERHRQDELWGDQSHLSLSQWFVILGEEIGELAKEILELDLEKEFPLKELETEAIQCAAVIFAMLEGLK